MSLFKDRGFIAGIDLEMRYSSRLVDVGLSRSGEATVATTLSPGDTIEFLESLVDTLKAGRESFDKMAEKRDRLKEAGNN